MKELLKQLLFEKEMYAVWSKGEDMSLCPDGWGTKQQKAFVMGMEHAYNILNDEKRKKK